MDDTMPLLDQAKQQGMIGSKAYENILSWLNNPQVAEYHEEIKKLVAAGQWEELNNAFFTQIEYGTAGIRGRTGLGSARINTWIVGSTTQGLADYIKAQGEAAMKRGVIIGSDTRLTSPEFVKLVASVLTSNGIQVYKFVRPPQVGMFSFAVRLYRAQAGIYISASHNPPTDNGLKIYWEDGGQLLPPHDIGIAEAVRQVTSYTNTDPKEGLIKEIGDDFDSTYRARILHESVYNGRSAQVVYSPFHGTGIYGVLPILQEAGFTIITVDEQMEPDGHFPNVPGGIPNPQNRESNTITAQKVLATGADLGISTDPDADRLGLIVHKGEETVILDGNQTINLLAYFICHQLKQAGELPKNGFLVRTFVTSPMIDAIAQDFGLNVYHTHVGFKYIGEVITKHEDQGDEFYIYGGEESFGSLKGSYARDKDASSAALIAAEMISWLKDNNRTVWDLFDEMYQRYGYYYNDLVDLQFEGAEGFSKMARLMDSLRTNPPHDFAGLPVHSIIDRKTNEICDISGQVLDTVDYHKANMLTFKLSADGKNTVTVRPSGTEPKMKLYVALYNEKAKENLPVAIEETKQQAEQLAQALRQLAEQLTQ